MAKRTRVPTRRGSNRKTARKAYKDAHQAQPPQRAARNVRSRGRPRGGSIEHQYTPELLENARYRVEETDEPLTSIAVDLGVHRTTFERLVLRKGWKRHRPPRDLSPAAKLLIEAERLTAAETLQKGKQWQPEEQTSGSAQVRENDGQLTDASAASVPAVEQALPIAEFVDRARSTVLRQLAAVEARQREPQRPIDAERDARTLANLTATLQKIERMQCATAQPGPHDDDIPTDINEFRRQLAHRINAFVESRTGGGDAGSSGG